MRAVLENVNTEYEINEVKSSNLTRLGKNLIVARNHPSHIYPMYLCVLQIIGFALKHKNDTGQANRVLLQSIEKARSNQIWMKKNYKTIVSWLEKAVSKLPASVSENIV